MVVGFNDITEILLKVALNTITHQSIDTYLVDVSWIISFSVGSGPKKSNINVTADSFYTLEFGVLKKKGGGGRIE